MTRTRWFCAWALALAVLGTGLPAGADVTVTVQITGTIEEILPVLQMLQQSGLDKAAAEQMEGLKLEIQSTAIQGAEGMEAPEEAVPAPPPEPSFEGVSVEPAAAKPGESVLITVKVADPQGKVNTVGASATDSGNYAFDLNDVGTNGDVVPNDGVWSYQYTIPANAPAGQLGFTVIAFDLNGEAVMVPVESAEPAPLTTQVNVSVQP